MKKILGVLAAVVIATQVQAATVQELETTINNQWNVVLNNRKLITEHKEKLAQVADELDYQTQFIRQNSEAIIQTQQAVTKGFKVPQLVLNRIDTLEDKLVKSDKKHHAGIASVAAMANIPQVIKEGTSGVGVGLGYKHNQSALAIGYSKATKKHIFKLSTGLDTQKDVTVGAGYLYQY